MNNEEYVLDRLKSILSKNNVSVGNIEITCGNYDDSGHLIKRGIPTLTTDLCEIGLYDNNVYFVVIANSSGIDRTNFNALSMVSNVLIYRFTDFNNTLYPKSNFNYDQFVEEINKEEKFQIQFNYKYNDELDIFKQYNEILGIIKPLDLMIVNQLKK